ncbi:lectin C-type domain protein, partial [Oesophagostomum dentatum]
SQTFAANCFCPRYHETYEQPENGCYRPVIIPAIQGLAERNCRHHHSSVIPKVDTYKKALFLSKLLPTGTKFWIGLKRVNGRYQWNDGQLLDEKAFNLWAPGYPKESEGDCVYMRQSDDGR